jgi:hypothetical protein
MPEIAAYATVALAVVTVMLFIATLSVARTTQREVAAQWRPALVPGRTVTPEQRSDVGFSLALYMVNPAIDVRGEILTVALHNAGTGPALDIAATLQPGDIPMASLSDANVILAGEQRSLTFSLPTPRVQHRLTATYQDLGNTKYTTAVDVTFEAGTPGTVDDEGDSIGGTDDRRSFGPVSLETL